MSDESTQTQYCPTLTVYNEVDEEGNVILVLFNPQKPEEAPTRLIIHPANHCILGDLAGKTPKKEYVSQLMNHALDLREKIHQAEIQEAQARFVHLEGKNRKIQNILRNALQSTEDEEEGNSKLKSPKENPEEILKAIRHNTTSIHGEV